MLKKLVLTGLILSLAVIAMSRNNLLAAPPIQVGQGTPLPVAATETQIALLTAVSSLLATPTLAPVGVVPATPIQQTATATIDPNENPPLATVDTLEPTEIAPEVTAVTDWVTPFNLSRSGATSDPQMVIDSDGRHHALWRDAIDGFAYATGDGTAWSEPVIIEAPFVTRRFLTEEEFDAETPIFTPYLVADAQSNLHAFWIDDSGRDTSMLYHSQVPAGQFTTFDAWSPRQALDSGAVAPSAALDSAGRLHLAYVRTVEDGERAAGVYYQRLDPGGAWSGPVALYLSRYLRSATSAEANVQVAATGDGLVIVAWDDAGREQVFVARSADSGRSWEPPREIDRRAAEDATEAAGPGGITIGGDAMAQIVTWRAGHEPGRTCTQYYRVSSDGGQTWSLPERLSDNLPDCLTAAQFIAADNALLLLGAIQTELTGGQIDQTAYLLAWDGARWSDPQTEDSLSAFINPDTNQPVELRCLWSAARGGDLSVIGCDRGTGGDAWWTRRVIGDPAAWFPPPSVWLGPERIAAVDEAIADLTAVADDAGSTHFFWRVTGGTDIYHSRWDGQNWSSAVPVLAAGSPVEELSAAFGSGRLHLVWRDGAGLHFAQAGAERPTEWSSPVDLGGVGAAAVAPNLTTAANGDLLLAYAIPLNEQRGIFLLRSEDQGASWSAPVVIFNAEAAGWDMAGRPQLAQTADGVLHALYLRRGLPPDAAPLDLGYSRSDTEGRVWSPVESNTTAKAEWSRILTAGQVVHRLWAETANERTVVWHAYSPDSGLSWSEPQQIAGLPGGQMPAAALDPIGRPQLVGMDGSQLLNWQWNGVGWGVGESLSTVLLPTSQLAAAVDVAVRLVVAVGATIPGTSAETTAEELYGMTRPLDFPSEALPTPPPPPATAVPTGTPASSPTPMPTPTLVISGAQDSNPLARIPGASGRTGQLAIAIIPAGLVVLAVVVVGFRAMRMGKK